MKIYWTKRSQSKFLEMDSYIKTKFGQSSSTKFKSKILNFIALLSKYPKLGTLEVAEKQIYGFQISKQTRIFYRIANSHISLLTFFDTRQDPKKKPK